MSTAETGAESTEAREIADRIKGLMKGRRVKLRELAEATEVPYRTLQDYLLGQTKIPASVVGRIARVLDVSTDALILGEEPGFDLDVVEDLMEIMKDFQVLIGNQINNRELAKIFINHYNKFCEWRLLGDARPETARPSRRKRAAGSDSGQE